MSKGLCITIAESMMMTMMSMVVVVVVDEPARIANVGRIEDMEAATEPRQDKGTTTIQEVKAMILDLGGMAVAGIQATSGEEIALAQVQTIGFRTGRMVTIEEYIVLEDARVLPHTVATRTTEKMPAEI